MCKIFFQSASRKVYQFKGTFWKCDSAVKTPNHRKDLPKFIFQLCQIPCVDFEKLTRLSELQGMGLIIIPTSFNITTI